jgi:hypothetical protein
MSKKLIAVASAAALALAGLVAVPTAANATLGPFSVSSAVSDTLSRAGAAANGTTGDLELTILVPSQDVLRLNVDANPASSTTGTLLRHIVTTPVGGAAVTVTAAGGGARLVTQAQVTAGNLTTASGTASVSVTTDSTGKVTVYSYTTSTADSTLTFVSGANSQVVFMKGVSTKDNAYKLNFTASPLDTAPGGEITFTGTVTDGFGNVLRLLDNDDITVSGLGGNLASITPTEWAQNATTGVVTFKAVNRSTTGAAAISLVMKATDLVPVAGAPARITAFGAPVGTQFFAVNAVDLSAQVTALTAQVAALKADYNALVTKWNKRVDSRKAPKKKAALK